MMICLSATVATKKLKNHRLHKQFLCFVFSAPSVKCTQSMVQVKYETVNNTCERGSQQVEAANEFQNPKLRVEKEKREKHRLNGRATVCCCENKHELSIIFLWNIELKPTGIEKASECRWG